MTQLTITTEEYNALLKAANNKARHNKKNADENISLLHEWFADEYENICKWREELEPKHLINRIKVAATHYLQKQDVEAWEEKLVLPERRDSIEGYRYRKLILENYNDKKQMYDYINSARHKEAILLWLRSGMSETKVAKEIGISHQAVSRAAKNLFLTYAQVWYIPEDLLYTQLPQ